MNHKSSNGENDKLKENSSTPWLRRLKWISIALLITAGVVIFFLIQTPFASRLGGLYELLTDHKRITALLEPLGNAAPLVYMALQMIQVVLAPIPGQATGFIGGYLFGAIQGTFYSIIALTLGSYINFLIGRILGKKWVRKMIPSVKFAKMDYLLRHQGLLLIFLLFLLPGFPKDYLCLFLGISSIPMRVFLLIALIGRFPGTLMLSLQGSLIFEKNYHILLLLIVINLIILLIGYHFRYRLYRWIDKLNGHSPRRID